MNTLEKTLAHVVREDLARYKDHVNGCSKDALYEQGVSHLDEGNLYKAKVAFEMLLKEEGPDSLPGLVVPLISSEMDLDRYGDRHDIVEKSAELSIYAMTESTDMYSKHDISLDELLLVERMVDRVSETLRESRLRSRDEYNKFYLRFKNYVIDNYVFERSAKV
ncbi:MAG: hypothetical protein ACLFTR_04850 [Candidatus Woesearchaeota archaeon]